MKLRLNIQAKLLLGFGLILLTTVLLVALVGHFWFVHEVQKFITENNLQQQLSLQPEGGGPPLGGAQAIFLFFAIIGGVMATLMSFIFARYLVKPIEQVIQATQEISQGKYNERIKLSRSDEVGDLCKAVNEMASKLEKTEQFRTELVSNVAHELATPLTNIGGYLRAINDGTINQEKPMKETLLLLESETDRLSDMVDDVRALYLVDNPNKKLKLESVDLKLLIHEVVQKMKPKIEANKLNIELKIEENLPNMSADRNKLTQILMNLLSNAISYTHDNGKVSISATREDFGIDIIVQDTGIGISTHDLPYIFERFYRVDKSRSRKTGGTGVGLTIVKDLVESHGGTVEVISQLGKGSEFICHFPQ
jgi:signal transduction histidine kinase